jgi:hypothetical protein
LIESRLVEPVFEMLDGLIGERKLHEQIAVPHPGVRTHGLEDEVVDYLLVENREDRLAVGIREEQLDQSHSTPCVSTTYF